MMRLLLVLLACMPGLAYAADPVAAEPPTKMSPIEVRANSMEFTRWIKVGSPNFILYTDAKASEATTILREFEMLHFAGQVAFNRRAARFGPIILVLPTARSDWRKLETMGADVEWKSAATAPAGQVLDVVLAQYDWQDEGLSIVRAVYAALHARRMDVHGPFWFGRGFGMFYQTAEFDRDRVALGRAHPQMWHLQDGGWLPWGRFFAVNPRSPEFTKESKIVLYEAQVAIFTQYLLAHQDRAWMGRLATWMEYLEAGGEPTEAKFQEIFGENWKSWQATMQTYLRNGSYSIFQVRVPPDVMKFTEIKYKLPVREIRELFVLMQTLVQRTPESKAALESLLEKGLQSEALQELLVDACLEWDHDDDALKLMRKLIADGSKNPRVYRMGDALLTRHAGAFTFATRYGAEIAEVREWDRRGLALEPAFSELNESLAVNEAGAPVVDQQSILTIEECYSRIKGRAPTDRVLAALAMALWRSGDKVTATELATRLRDDPLCAKSARKVVEEMLASESKGTLPAGATLLPKS
ncbi:hypothetical protein [Opitutus sp. ER46]|uniref:hypothetical protein n=1 Tax=Opitutus sp. ER46 TaxID=2161864 RepID=UPI0011B21501|nr:hypothetical protein [Opitutus sp. ER46]